ncbi:hypothetical protein COHA_003638 [Chlorella ohadii]|uniref:Uncharacterized protein n=1 Tax=Chlorella ohadii TaxID=2649997 RepID=A0AAD5H7T0_9CHLO|nr:hypothetical protein COHA_003638 [Chlorella ohadii]
MAGTGRDAVDQTYKVPSFATSMKFLERMATNSKKHAEAEARAERARAAAAEEDSGDEEEERRCEAVIQGLQQMADKMQQAVNLEGMREVEAVLAPLPPPQLSDQDDVDLDAGYLDALTAARSALGLDDVLPELTASREDRLELFAVGLRSGYVCTTALQRGAAPAPLVQALLSTMTQSPDTQTAGAAFVTLMALMGDDAAASLSAAAALLSAFDETDWERKLPQLADRLAEMGPSHQSRYHKLLCNLPTAAPRGLALQQFAGAVLLERLLPASNKLAPAKSAINRRDATRLDPVAVIEAQPWFSNGKRMVEGATSGAAVVPHGGYSMGTLELLLNICHLLLWPHTLAHVAGEASCVSPPFLRRWHEFLAAVQKHIKSPQMEDQNVKTLATLFDMEYKNVCDGLEPMAL